MPEYILKNRELVSKIAFRELYHTYFLITEKCRFERRVLNCLIQVDIGATNSDVLVSEENGRIRDNLEMCPG